MLVLSCHKKVILFCYLIFKDFLYLVIILKTFGIAFIVYKSRLLMKYGSKRMEEDKSVLYIDMVYIVILFSVY